MLIEFRFKNFKSFKDEAVLSLVASNDKTFSENLISCPDDKLINLLSSLAIYGPNASGKSTIFEAFGFVLEFVSHSAQNNPDDPIKYKPFLFDDSKTQPTFFELTFIKEGVRYQYGFATTQHTIAKEWLISYPKGRPRKLFDREYVSDGKYAYYFSSYFKGEKEKIKELTRSNALFLSVGATFNNPQLLEIYRWFTDQTIVVSSGEIAEPAVFNFILKHPNIAENLRNLIKFADLGVVDYALAERDSDSLNLPSDMPMALRKAFEAFDQTLKSMNDEEINIKHKAYVVNLLHQSGSNVASLPWDAESDGTRRLFGMSAPVFDALDGGKTLFIDEIDKSLHPLLARELVSLFQNSKTNPKGAQLVFNTHDTSLLSAGIFRRDQIWFLEKDNNGASHLYSLLEYSPRRDEALEKGYLQGRYGAVPFLGEYLFGGK